MMKKIDADRFRAYIAAKEMDIQGNDGGGCETCGYGGEEYHGYSLEAINKILDEFLEEQYKIFKVLK